MDNTIQVNFNQPMPVFPLMDVVLLPHAVQHLHVFEKRYRQMVKRCLDSAGQIAMASYAGTAPDDLDDDLATLRPAVCVGQIIHHHRLPDGRYNVVLLGVCRAQIVEIQEPEGERLFRLAYLRLHEETTDGMELSDVRHRLESLLKRPRISSLRGLSKLTPLFEQEEVPTNALVELIASTLVEDPALRYKLLAESDVRHRAALLDGELRHLDRLVRAAESQLHADWPKGQSWN